FAMAFCTKFESFDDLLSDGGDFAQEFFSREFSTLTGHAHDMELTFAGWSDETDAPRIAFMLNFEGTPHKPWTMHEYPAVIAPMPSETVARAAGVREDVGADNFDPARDAIPLMNAQRHS